MTLQTNSNNLPITILVSDDVRMANPEPLLRFLPRGAFVLLRSKSEARLCKLAGEIIPRARQLGIKVLIAGPVRLAHKLGADGAHLNEATIKRRKTSDIWPGGRMRKGTLRKGFVLSASAHGRAGLMRAKGAGVDFVLLGQVYPSHSHPGNKPLGTIGFCLLAGQSPVPVVAIGGINRNNARRLTPAGAGKKIIGLAGIEMFGNKN